MSRFTRSAPWLRNFFTASQTGFNNPGILSDEVSLVQVYDAGGFGLQDPGEFGTQITSATIAAGNTELILTTADEIFRLIAVSALLAAGVSPTVSLSLRSPTAVDVGTSVPTALNANHHQALIPINCYVLPPSTSLRGVHAAGDAATIVDWRVYGIRMPLGASPQI